MDIPLMFVLFIKKLLRIVDKSYPQTKYDYFFEGGGAGNTYIITKNVALSFQNF